MDSITAQSLTRLCTHLRNMCKASEVLGCSKQRKQTRSADVTLANLPAGLFVQFRGADGSELDIPLHGMEEVPESIRMACVGLNRSDFALAGTSGAHKESQELKAAQDRARKLEEGWEALVNKCRAHELEAKTAERLLAKAQASPASDAPNVAKLRADLDKACQYALTLELQLESALSGVKGDDALVRRVDELTRENQALQRTVDKLRTTPRAPVADDAAQGPQVTVPDSSGILDTLRQRSDVTVSADGRRVEFHKAQGYGVGDRLKAEGFKYNTAEHKEGRKVWLR